MMRRYTIPAIMIIWMLVFVPALTAQTKVKLMVFGGSDHKVYLGCLSCDTSEQDSIFNPTGPYGHCPIFGDSLFCRGPLKSFGTMGPLNNLSACATGASNPPVIVDEFGNYYGRFSIVGPLGHGDSVCAIVGRFTNDDACGLVRWVCEQAR